VPPQTSRETRASQKVQKLVEVEVLPVDCTLSTDVNCYLSKESAWRAQQDEVCTGSRRGRLDKRQKVSKETKLCGYESPSIKVG
jgi:hypothetical protein